MTVQPPSGHLPPPASCDIIVVGAGAVGLAAGIGLAGLGFHVTLVGQPATQRPGRTVAMLQGSVALLDDIGVWTTLAPSVAPLRTMRLVDATGSLFSPPPVSFRASEIGLDAFGYNVDNAALEHALQAVATATPGLTVVTASAKDFAYGDGEALVTTDRQQRFSGHLLVAADGRQSQARKAARIGVRVTDHPQTALTAIFRHEAPHHDTSTEFHTRQGPFTLVPMPPTSAGVHRSSLVWVMNPKEAARRRLLAAADFAREAETQCTRLLGDMTLDSQIGAFPIVTSSALRLTAKRLVLIGEAAHALPPIGAQGLNLSYRDVIALVDHLRAARGHREDIGAIQGLDHYARARTGDVMARTAGVGALNGSLLNHRTGMDLMRGLGLAALGGIAPLRRLAMRQGLAAKERLPAPT
ncbi:FAD-dependent monooxygenase [Lichenifustis flavocetrariae]|uniref:FAD-dependent monooxygenase n=1 Tax=Lichenifustis flavocetrariae TaxID=2949735 RepID=A0AA41YSB2_9HYPH|nr:FAD-dependent monooxygenase [Lichenifustis flavocetrariae]MCW6507269.1 FAD-dependent monooxygenase [Lichenifustis flavocetrariae]